MVEFLALEEQEDCGSKLNEEYSDIPKRLFQGAVDHDERR